MRPLVLGSLFVAAFLAANAGAVPKKPLKKPVEPPTKIVDEHTPSEPHSEPEPEPEPDSAPVPSEVELSVKQLGPGLPWSYEIKNAGERPVRVAADPRLLWFEVQVPGKKKRRTCRLPAELFPKHADKDFSLMLRPGERFGQRFDPRLYCFAAGGQTDLVAGAIVYPRFGWPKEFKTSWKGGKKLQTPILDAPFAVTPPERPRRGKKKPDGKPAELPKKETHLKLVEGKALGLRSAYAGWSKDALHEDDEKPEQSDWDSPEPVLSMQTGSDAAAERLATVQVKLKNPSKDRKLVVYFRRELLSFEVMGPDGLRSCTPEPRTRFPEAQAFTTLGPGRSISVVSRLVELCPRGTFDRPGLYLIRARFDSKDDGAEFGLQGFTGRILAEQPATVRIRGGEKPFRLPRR